MTKTSACLFLATLVSASACQSDGKVQLNRNNQATFTLPEQGKSNNGGTIGPFCCTGETATLLNQGGKPLGYAYFFGWKGQAFNSSHGAYYPDLQLLVSGATDASDPSSSQVQNEIDFTAAELKPGFSRTTKAGGLAFTATVESVDKTADGQNFYKASLKVDVAPN